MNIVNLPVFLVQRDEVLGMIIIYQLFEIPCLYAPQRRGMLDFHGYVSMAFPKMVTNKTDSKCLCNKAFNLGLLELPFKKSPITNPFRILFIVVAGSCLKNYPFFVDFPYQPPGDRPRLLSVANPDAWRSLEIPFGCPSFHGAPKGGGCFS